MSAFLPVAGNNLILAIPLALGLALGFQTIHTKFGADSWRVLTTFMGWVYWLSRALVPVAAYVIWYHLQEEPHDSAMTALLCGLGSEALLRSRFYLGEKTAPDGKVDEVAKGVFDLVHWYQALCLKAAGDKLAKQRKEAIKSLLGSETDFRIVAGRAKANAGAWAIEEEKAKLIAVVNDLTAQFDKAAQGLSGADLQKVNRDFIGELGYAAMRLVGRTSLETLFK